MLFPPFFFSLERARSSSAHQDFQLEAFLVFLDMPIEVLLGILSAFFIMLFCVCPLFAMIYYYLDCGDLPTRENEEVFNTFTIKIKRSLLNSTFCGLFVVFSHSLL